jgi:hypothetical protein
MSMSAESIDPSATITGDGRYLASYEIRQGGSVERLAVFENGVVDFRWLRPGKPAVKNRLRLPKLEVETIQRVLKEGLAVPSTNPAEIEKDLSPGQRSFRIQLSEVLSGEGRIFLFDETRPMPMPIGRVRGALEDLRARLLEKEIQGRAKDWDPAGVGLGSRLIRRSDGLVFVVTIVDSFGNMLELEETARRLERTKIKRVELPAIFELSLNDEILPPATPDDKEKVP